MRSLDDEGQAQRRQVAYFRSHSELSSGSQQGLIPHMDTPGGLADLLTFTLYPLLAPLKMPGWIPLTPPPDAGDFPDHR